MRSRILVRDGAEEERHEAYALTPHDHDFARSDRVDEGLDRGNEDREVSRRLEENASACPVGMGLYLCVVCVCVCVLAGGWGAVVAAVAVRHRAGRYEGWREGKRSVNSSGCPLENGRSLPDRGSGRRR